MSKSLTPTITQVGQLGSTVNAYLVHEDDGLTLVDGLQGNASKKILAAAAEIGKPITRTRTTSARSIRSSRHCPTRSSSSGDARQRC